MKTKGKKEWFTFQVKKISGMIDVYNASSLEEAYERAKRKAEDSKIELSGKYANVEQEEGCFAFMTNWKHV